MSKPTPEDFFNAYVRHQTISVGTETYKDAMTKLMLKHALWLSEEARRRVDVQSWIDFARTGVLGTGEELDVEMDEWEIDDLLRRTSCTPALALPPSKRRRVSVLYLPFINRFYNTLTLPVAKHWFPLLPRICFRGSTS